MKEILIVIALLAVAMVLFSVRILLKKNGSFSSHDVGASPAMRERGIGCTRSQDRMAQRGNPKRIEVKKL